MSTGLKNTYGEKNYTISCSIFQLGKRTTYLKQKSYEIKGIYKKQDK